VSSAAPALTSVDRRRQLSYADFVAEYRNPNRPVIITDAIKDWPALGKFTPEFFQAHCGDRPVPIGDRHYKLGDFLDLLLKSTPANPAPYPCKLDLRTAYADLAADVPRYRLADPDRTHSSLLARRFLAGLADLEVFIGGPGGEFPYVHYDFLGLYAYINQVYGDKEFLIYPPGQEQYLYVKPDAPWQSGIDNVFRPDYAQYPLFAHARPVVEVLTPGETLFIPCGWWHTARSLTVSISVAFDQLCHSNWAFFTAECLRFRAAAGLKAAVIRAYLGTVGAALTASERLRGDK
jgi:histone arginine demethylase JMJD6